MQAPKTLLGGMIALSGGALIPILGFAEFGGSLESGGHDELCRGVTFFRFLKDRFDEIRSEAGVAHSGDDPGEQTIAAHKTTPRKESLVHTKRRVSEDVARLVAKERKFLAGKTE